MKKFVILLTVIFLISTLVGCDDLSTSGSYTDTANTQKVAGNLATKQPTPTDINFSLERYNLIRRAYWVNGQREKANNLPCEVTKPLGYIVLFTEGGGIVGSFTVDGKVSSLNSFLTPDSEYYELVYGGTSHIKNDWLADVDGSYGENDTGIFFFTTDGKYVEWTGTYLYSDIPMKTGTPIVNYAEVQHE